MAAYSACKADLVSPLDLCSPMQELVGVAGQLTSVVTDPQVGGRRLCPAWSLDCLCPACSLNWYAC